MARLVIVCVLCRALKDTNGKASRTVHEYNVRAVHVRVRVLLLGRERPSGDGPRAVRVSARSGGGVSAVRCGHADARLST